MMNYPVSQSSSFQGDKKHVPEQKLLGFSCHTASWMDVTGCFCGAQSWELPLRFGMGFCEVLQNRGQS